MFVFVLVIALAGAKIHEDTNQQTESQAENVAKGGAGSLPALSGVDRPGRVQP